MKTFLKILAGLAVLGVIAFAAVLHFTSGMSDAADGFFRAARADDMPAAQAFMSQEFRAGTPEDALRAFLALNALDEVEETSWTRREVSGATGELEGTVTTASGGTVPVELVFVKEGEAWKLHGISKRSGGIEPAVAAAPLPDAAAQAALLRQTVADFGASIAAQDMTHFRGTAATVWQEQFPLEQFEASFGSIYAAGFDFAAAAALEPELEPATALGEQGELVVRGRFPSQPPLVVQAKYVHEGTWKPYGFQVDTE